MSFPFFGVVKCSVCGEESKQSALASTSAFGSMDLDTRPPEPHRNTMKYWIQECPHCGYTSDSLEELIKCDKEYLNAIEYKDFARISPVSELAQKFIRKARISTKSEDYIQAFMDYLHAAWVSDDEEDEAWQIEARMLALQTMSMFGDDMNDNHRVMRADLLRKTHQFVRLTEEYETLFFSDDLLSDIIQFQVMKAKSCDTATYTVEDILTEHEENFADKEDSDDDFYMEEDETDIYKSKRVDNIHDWERKTGYALTDDEKALGLSFWREILGD